MYRLKQDKKEFILKISQTQYAKELGVTTPYLCRVMGGVINCKKVIAKGILSIRFQKSMDSVELEELLDEYFSKEEE